MESVTDRADANPFRMSLGDLERSSGHMPGEDVVEVEDPQLHTARALPDSVEPRMRGPLQPRRVTLPDGNGQIDRQLSRVLLTLLVLGGLVVLVGFLSLR